MSPLAPLAHAVRERLIAGEPAPLPGFGTLVRRHLPARIDVRPDGARALLPPGATVEFTPSLTQDTALAPALADLLGEADGTGALQAAIDQIDARLAATGTAVLPGVGRFERSGIGVFFRPDASWLDRPDPAPPPEADPAVSDEPRSLSEIIKAVAGPGAPSAQAPALPAEPSPTEPEDEGHEARDMPPTLATDERPPPSEPTEDGEEDVESEPVPPPSATPSDGWSDEEPAGSDDRATPEPPADTAPEGPIAVPFGADDGDDLADILPTTPPDRSPAGLGPAGLGPSASLDDSTETPWLSALWAATPPVDPEADSAPLGPEPVPPEPPEPSSADPAEATGPLDRPAAPVPPLPPLAVDDAEADTLGDFFSTAAPRDVFFVDPPAGGPGPDVQPLDGPPPTPEAPGTDAVAMDTVATAPPPRRRSVLPWIVGLVALVALVAAAMWWTWPPETLEGPTPDVAQVDGLDAEPDVLPPAVVEADSAAVAAAATTDSTTAPVTPPAATPAASAGAPPIPSPAPSPSTASAAAPTPPASGDRALGRPPPAGQAILPPRLAGLSEGDVAALSGSAPVTASSGGFTWQIISFPAASASARAQAEALAARYRTAGYRVGVLPTGSGSGRRLVVCVGQFTSREQAERLRDRLPPQAPADTWVRDLSTL